MDETTRRAVVHAGGVHFIMKAMTKHLDYPRLQYNACGALRNLLVSGSRDFSVASQIKAKPADLPQPLPPIPRNPSRSAGLSGRTSVPMPVQLPPATSAKARAALLGGPRHIRSTSSLPRTNVRTQEDPAAAGFGRRSVRPESAVVPVPPRRDDMPDVLADAQESVLEQALSLTISSMKEHAETPLVQEYGCGTLMNLLLCNGMPMRSRVVDEGGIAVVCKAMKTYPMDAGLQLNATKVLKELSEAGQKTAQILEANSAKELIEANKSNHPYNHDLIAMCEQCLASLI